MFCVVVRYLCCHQSRSATTTSQLEINSPSLFFVPAPAPAPGLDGPRCGEVGMLSASAPCWTSAPSNSNATQRCHH